MFSKTKRFFLVTAIGFTTISFFNLNMVANAADVMVNLDAPKQEIDGFGASSAWCGSLSDNIMNSLYGELGYSILRLRIEENIGDNWKTGNFNSWAPELSNAKKTSAKGAIVFASPWNPPKSMQENFSKSGDASAQRLRYDKYGEYVDYLNAYVTYMKDNGVDLYAVSIQNEPDYAADWNWWTPTEMLTFMKNNAGDINCKVISPESFQYRKDMSDPILNDPAALANMDILGFHLYGTAINQFAYPLFQQKGTGKKAWQTEHFFDDDNMSNVMKLGKELHDCMVTRNMNGYIYWWITWPNGLWDNDNNGLYKRAYALGQFAKHIRPGYFRVDATPTPATNVYVSAYTGDGNVVIVAVNNSNSSVNQKFTIQNGPVSQISSWQTTSSSNMAAGQSYQVSGGSFSATLPSQSITTFVGLNPTSIKQSPFSSIETAQLKGDGFITGIAKGAITVTPLDNAKTYDIKTYSLNGRIMIARNGIKGVSAIPVATKGIYVLNILCNGRNQQKMVSVY